MASPEPDVALEPAAPVVAATIRLRVTAGPHAGREFLFDRHATFLLGRSSEAHCSLPDKDKYLSRHHFLIEANPPACRLIDLRSHNGTKWNGVRVETADLRDGDRIEVGETHLIVEIAQGDAASTQTLGATPPAARPSEHSTVLPEAPAWPAVPGYRMVGKLGEGGMGAVHKAVHEASGALAAIKTLRSRLPAASEAVARFRREARVLESLTHPNIVAFREMIETEAGFCFAMEFVDGSDAATLLRLHGPMALGRAARLACQLLEALANAHAQGIVHRDLKPGNLLVTSQDGREIAKVTDFGLARAWQESSLGGLTITGEQAGTPAFMPPEQILDFHGVRPSGDQYAAAATLYSLLTGSSLFPSLKTPAELFKRILQDEPMPIRRRREEVPEALAAAIHRALDRKPENRFADVVRFREALEPFAQS
jgi:eukaryotic-like serine/threonine-protein kinase